MCWQLIHFFTAGSDEVKAWTLKEGKNAQEAAACIHSDISKNFICAEVMVSRGDSRTRFGLLLRLACVIVCMVLFRLSTT